MKLLGRETNQSIMMFEETLPAGTASLFHLHRDSDEVAWMLAGEFTFLIGDAVTAGGPGTCVFMPRDIPHAWKNTGSETGRVLFLYTPTVARRRQLWGSNSAGDGELGLSSGAKREAVRREHL